MVRPFNVPFHACPIKSVFAHKTYAAFDHPAADDEPQTSAPPVVEEGTSLLEAGESALNLFSGSIHVDVEQFLVTGFKGQKEAVMVVIPEVDVSPSGAGGSAPS